MLYAVASGRIAADISDAFTRPTAKRMAANLPAIVPDQCFRRFRNVCDLAVLGMEKIVAAYACTMKKAITSVTMHPKITSIQLSP